MQSLPYAQPRQTTDLSALRASEPLVTVPVPDAAVDRLLSIGLPELRDRAAITWERPERGVALFGFGVAVRIQGPRNSPLTEVREALERIRFAGADVELASRPRAFGGGRFDPAGTETDHRWDAFGGWQFTVPSLLLACENEGVTASLTLPEGSNFSASAIEARIDQLIATPSRPLNGTILNGRHRASADESAWHGMVRQALDEIAGARYQKVVLARSVEIEAATANIGRMLTALAARYPTCFVFKYRAGGHSWLGASPELLVSLRDGVLHAASLAGSRPRGADEAEDQRLHDELLASPKERQEHEFVRAAIEDNVAPFCSRLDYPPQPTVVRMANIQHLSTPFRGVVKPGVNLLDIVARLHPTPAVGGSPRDVAMEAIDRIERLDRGWYAGPIGWIDFEGSGEFAVALRSGLVGGGFARLHAGAGIVEGSDPAHEWAETETKLRPMRESLAAG